MAKINIGDKFGRLTVSSKGKLVGRARYWFCICICGKTKEICYTALVQGRTKSCGCLGSELSSERRKTHGMSKTRDYVIWCNMNQRCNDEKSTAYKHYGGRGISICDRWKSFENFIADMGPSHGRTIDRINNDLGYSPENCKWSDYTEQANNRRSNIFLAFNGKTQTLRRWANEIGLSNTTLWNRINTLKWSVEKSLTTKNRQSKPKE